MTTLTDHPNATVVSRLYEAVNLQDVGKLTALVSPDVTVLIPGKSPLAGLYNGRDAVFGFFGAIGAASNGTYRAELKGMYANDTQVVAVHHGTGTRGEATLDTDAALVFVITRGVITAITVHQKSQDGWDEFFSGRGE
jgi:ketosteroid isomerase-like protein